jgi:hypothetical protein
MRSAFGPFEAAYGAHRALVCSRPAAGCARDPRGGTRVKGRN